MTGESRYTLENLMEFYRVAAKRIGLRRYQIIRFLYFFGGGALVLLGLYYGSGVLFRGDGDAVSLLLAVLGLYLGVQFFRTGVLFYRYFAAKALKSIPERSLRCFFSFEDTQIVISNQMKSTSYPYEKFGMIYETSTRFHFYINAYNGYVLEKSGIKGSPEQLRELLNGKREDPVEWVDI